MVTVTIGALALSGIFPFSGFFSKEAVLGQLWSLDNKLWVGLGLFGAFLTAYYAFRVIFVMLFPGLIITPPGRSITRRWQAATVMLPTRKRKTRPTATAARGISWRTLGHGLPAHRPGRLYPDPGILEGYLQKFLLGEVHHHPMNVPLTIWP